MSLPPYNQNISLEEALQQFDYATSQLVLHPFNGNGEETVKRRAHVSEAARDTYLTTSRWYGILERDHENTRKLNQCFDRKLSERYLRDISSCRKVLVEKVISWYSRLEKRGAAEIKRIDRLNEQGEYEAKVKELKEIKREKSLITNYVSLMGIINEFVRAMLVNESEEDHL